LTVAVPGGDDGKASRRVQERRRGNSMSFDAARLKLLSFDVFGTLVNVRGGSYDAFEHILKAANAAHVDVKAFWEVWEDNNIARYWQPYRCYKEICRDSLAASFEAFGIEGRVETISYYFDAFPGFALYPDVVPTLDALSRRYELAIVSNIDDDLLSMTQLPRTFDLVCSAERAKGYKPNGALFRYLLANAGVARQEILHSGQSQFTDMVGAKPLGLAVAWINRRGVALSNEVPPPDFEFADIKSLLGLLMPAAEPEPQ
jgi:2-haloacid dehalogenase